MYNDQRFLVANPINRYSIGSRTKGLKTNKDGSIDIYISYKSPGKDKESNWLPAPDGVPHAAFRTYGPGPDILSGSYKLPPLIKINK